MTPSQELIVTDYRVEKSISASPDEIWQILIDAPLYPEWNPAVQKIEGVIAPDEKLEVTATANPKRTFTLRVTGFTAPKSMTWTTVMPLGTFKGVLTYSLDPAADGSTKFVMQEVYSGWPSGPMTKRVPDLTESFEQFANGLKAKAEGAPG
jgi:hypothetical protein